MSKPTTTIKASYGWDTVNVHVSANEHQTTLILNGAHAVTANLTKAQTAALIAALQARVSKMA